MTVESFWVKCEGRALVWWRITKELLKQKLQVFVNKCLRTILRIWWPRRIRNDELWRQTGQRPIEEEIRERAWGWIGHTLRRPDGHVAKTALEWNPQAGEAQERETPAHLEAHNDVRTWRERAYVSWGKSHCSKLRVRWRAFIWWRTYVPSGTKRTDDGVVMNNNRFKQTCEPSLAS